MQLPVRELSVFIRVAIFLLFGALSVAQGDNTLEAGPGQNLTSTGKIYSTSTAQPAMLAIGGGTIRSTGDQVAVLPGGLTALQAEGIGSQITAKNFTILALGLGQTGISGAMGIDGGSVASTAARSKSQATVASASSVTTELSARKAH